MANATSAFFTDLAARGSDPVIGSVRGTVRIDVVDGPRTDSWRVSMHDGAIGVTEGTGEADCVVRTTPAAFAQLASGGTNALAATLRGAVELEGDLRLLVRFQRLFPPPTGMPVAAGARSAGKRRG